LIDVLARQVENKLVAAFMTQAVFGKIPFFIKNGKNSVYNPKNYIFVALLFFMYV